MKRGDLRDELQLAFEDLALIRAEHLRLIAKAEEMRRPLEKIWVAAELGPLPEYEPEIRLRRVA